MEPVLYDAAGHRSSAPMPDVLIASLMSADLIDEYLLTIAPLVLGTGRRMFPDGVHRSLQLTDSTTTSKGVILATYKTV